MDAAVDTKDGTNRITYRDLIEHPEMKAGVADMSPAARAALFREFIARNRLDDKNFFAATPNNWGWHLLDPARRECVALAPKDLHDYNQLAVDMLGIGIIEVIGAVPGVIEPSDFTTGQLQAMCALNPELMNESARSKYPVLQEIAGMPKIDVMDAFLTARDLDVDTAIARLPAADGREIATLEEWAAEKEAALDAVRRLNTRPVGRLRSHPRRPRRVMRDHGKGAFPLHHARAVRFDRRRRRGRARPRQRSDRDPLRIRAVLDGAGRKRHRDRR